MPAHRPGPPPWRPRRQPATGPLAQWGAWLACLALAGLVGLLMARRPLTVRLSVDGQDRILRTQAGSVGDLLALAAITLYPDSRVSPPPSARLADGATVRVERGRPVRVRAEGRSVALRAIDLDPRAVLKAAGFAPAAGDRLTLNGRPWPLDRPFALRSPVVQVAGGPGRSVPRPDEAPAGDAGGAPPTDDGREWRVELFRAVPVTVEEDGLPYPLMVAGATVGEGLAGAGLALEPGDLLLPPADTPLVAEMRIRLQRGTPFTLQADGAERAVRAHAATVGEALPLLGIALGPADYPEPPADTPLSAGLVVNLVRVEERVESREVEIPFGRETRADPEAELDTVAVVQAGAPGRKAQTVRLVVHDGRVADTQVLEETVLQEPTTEIVSYGTRVVWRTVDTEQGPKQYWRKLNVYATSYSLSRSGSNPNAPWYGRTRMGLPMAKGIIAVDPKVIPLGMWLYVPGYGVGIAGDTGGGIKRYHIDLGFDDDNYESWHRRVDVYILDRLPPEHQMPWILP